MNRRVGVLAVSALAVALSVPSYAASHSAVPHGQKRVCAATTGRTAACHAHVVTNAKTGKPLATTTPSGGYIDDQLRAAYPPGATNELVAIVDAYANPNAQQDLDAYRTAMGLPLITLQQSNQNGGSITTVSGNVGWGQEEMLDLEMVSAICPSCPILYVGANSNSFTDLSAAVNRARTLQAKVISNSYGGSEFSQETSGTYSGAYNATGAIVTVSSGDSGYGVEFPAAASGVVAVGGTSLTFNSSGQKTETVWSGAGSGCSAYVGKPGWQSSSVTQCSRRMVADVSAVANPSTGVDVYDSYGSSNNANWYVFGGTSVAAPIIGAIYGSYGESNTANVQNLWKFSTSLYDVTSGSNGHCTGRNKRSPGAPALWCTGVVGYDGPSGNGTPNGSSAPF